MFIKQSDFFWDMSKDCVKAVINTAEKKSFSKEDILFEEGDPAELFFVLLKGRVKLQTGQSSHTVYSVSHSGEAFGWSALIGRNAYSASAICVEDTKLLIFDKTSLNSILEQNNEYGLSFFKSLAKMLGNRLIRSYGIKASMPEPAAGLSFGTGQLLEGADMH